MTNEQLYFAIGIPIVCNFAIIAVFYGLLNTNLNKRIDDLRSDMNARFDGMEKLFTEKLLRVEQVMDARIRHLEENTGRGHQ